VRRLLPLLAVLAACSGPALGDPSTVLQRMQDLQAEGETDDVAELGQRAVASPEVPSEDRAEAAYLAGEAEYALGHYGAAFERYRWILENAPWSEHVTALEDRLFEMGRTMLFGEEYSGWFDDRGRGVELLETLAAHFRASPRADDALRMVGDYFASDDVQAWGEASLSYLRVADEYPDSEWAERCLWLAGHCRLRDARGPAYDRNELLRAAALLQRSLTTHPRGVAVLDARADLAACREQLAQAELVVADFYAGRGVPPGEIVRLANAASLYRDTPAGQAAAARLVAMGLDPAALARDPRRNSIDTVKFVTPRWEREAEEQRQSEQKGEKRP
jgi:tetratricopeptide (TPR) repeat protein